MFCILNMLNVFVRDKAKLNGWSQSSKSKKIIILISVLWKEKLKIFKILEKKHVYIRQIELVLTTKCTLRCKECANLMQYYKRPYDVKEETIMSSIEKIMDKVDEIGTLVLVGGEPFLYKELGKLICVIAAYSKVDSINIFTNGTLVPNNENLIKELKNNKVKIIISDYGNISKNKYKLKELCEKEKINYHLKTEDLEWGFVGKLETHNRSNQELQKQFIKCNNYCRSVLNGKLFYCPRAAHGEDLGVIKSNPMEKVDLLDEKVETKDILRIIYSRYYFTACNYCNYGTKSMISIEPGKQMMKRVE